MVSTGRRAIAEGKSIARPDRRQDVLAELRQAPEPTTIVALAERLDIHPNTARFHLDILEKRGQVERVDPPTAVPGRPALHFRARATFDPAGPRSYQLLAGVLAESLADTPDAGRRATNAGRAWGRDLVHPSLEPLPASEATEQLVGMLTDLGFAPSPQASEDGEVTQLALGHCPFLELAGQRPEVICPVHLGLMQGALEELTDEIVVETLDPFVEPDLCLAHLSLRKKEGLPCRIP